MTQPAFLKNHIDKLKRLTKHNFSVIWAEMELISAILQMYEGNLIEAKERLHSLASYAIELSLMNLHEKVIKQQHMLNVYQTYQNIEDRFQSVEKEEELKSRSMKDVVRYLISATNLLRSYSSEIKQTKE